MFRTIHNPQYGVPTPPSRPSPQTPIARPPPSTPAPKKGGYGDGGFWRVAQNSQALGRYNGLRHNRAAGSSVMPYGSLLTTAAYYPKMAFDAYRSLPVAVQLLGGIFAVTAIYGYLDQKGYV